eukprot:c29002_g1_i1 orf=1190-2446(+)
MPSPHLNGHKIRLLLYADDVVIFTNSESQMQEMMNTFSNFCTESGMAINVNKTKTMITKTIQPRSPLQITYRGHHIETVHSFKYLGIEIPANNRWSTCVHRRLDAGWGKYFQFENECYNSNTRRWHTRNMIFGAYVIQTVLYGVELWGGSISISTWNEIEKMQKSFIRRHLGIKATTPYSILLLETGCIPIELHALKRVFKYITKVKNMDGERLPKKAWEESQKLQKTHKGKILASGWALDIRNWFKRWAVEDYLNRAPEDSNEEAFHQDLLNTLHRKWQTAGNRDKYEYYCTFINPNYWSTYAGKETTTQQYICIPMALHKRRALAQLRTRSHQLQIEIGSWKKQPRECRICHLCDQHMVETEEHMVMTCPNYAHIREEFKHLLVGHNKIADLLHTESPSALGTFVFKLFKHRNPPD